MALGLEIACGLWLCWQRAARPVHDYKSYIGSAACRPELRGNGAEFGLALDRKQRVYAEIRQLDGKPTLLVIQYADDVDRCGELRDIVSAPDPKDLFIGIHQGPPGARRWKASMAWVIDFEKLKLNPTNDSVTCLNYSYAGADDGSDVRSRTASRARKPTP